MAAMISSSPSLTQGTVQLAPMRSPLSCTTIPQHCRMPSRGVLSIAVKGRWQLAKRGNSSVLSIRETAQGGRRSPPFSGLALLSDVYHCLAISLVLDVPSISSSQCTLSHLITQTPAPASQRQPHGALSLSDHTAVHQGHLASHDMIATLQHVDSIVRALFLVNFSAARVQTVHSAVFPLSLIRCHLYPKSSPGAIF